MMVVGIPEMEGSHATPTAKDIRTLLAMAEAGVYLTIAVSAEEPPMVNWPKEWEDFRVGTLQWALRWRHSPARYMRRYRAPYPPGMGIAEVSQVVARALSLLEAAVWTEGEDPSFEQLDEAEEELWELAVETVFEQATAGTEGAVMEKEVR